MTISNNTHFGPWTYTCQLTGRLLTHSSGYRINIDALRNAEGAEFALGHVQRKPWAKPLDVSGLREALTAIGMLRAKNGRAA